MLERQDRERRQKTDIVKNKCHLYCRLIYSKLWDLTTVSTATKKIKH